MVTLLLNFYMAWFERFGAVLVPLDHIWNCDLIQHKYVVSAYVFHIRRYEEHLSPQRETPCTLIRHLNSEDGLIDATFKTKSIWYCNNNICYMKGKQKGLIREWCSKREHLVLRPLIIKEVSLNIRRAKTWVHLVDTRVCFSINEHGPMCSRMRS